MLGSFRVLQSIVHLSVDPEKPYHGLWIGDYASHGVEFLLFLQRYPTLLEVFKITGDVNVPCGQLSFTVPDLNVPGRICDEIEFQGCRAVPGYGQIAQRYFTTNQWIDVEGCHMSTVSDKQLSLSLTARFMYIGNC